MKPVLLLLLFVCFLLSSSIKAQGPCRPPEIVFNKSAPNIFTEEQEMYLGEVLAETLDKNFAVMADDNASAYLRQIGEKLVKHLPPTNIKFQFFVVDSPELNAFNVAGGRVYVTRKLISFVKTEDELAGILGHELGHGIVRHHSTDLSRLFKEILGIDRVGDRQDVFEKFNQLVDRQRTKRVRPGRGHEGDQQLEADRIGLFAMIAAGYDPNAYATAWERMTEIKGKTGNSLSDFFGSTRPEEKRLREMLKAIGSIPAECRDKSSSASVDQFAKWQAYVISIVKVRHKEKFRGLISKGSLQPFLRGVIKHFQFSPNGKYILAQDASGINILSRDPFKFLFRVNVKDAKFANFSPDSQKFVFQTFGLRVEVWDVASGKLSMAREVYVRGRCWQSALSPDGKTLVCYSSRGNLDLIDVATNEKILTKEKFYIPSVFEYIAWQFDLYENEEKEIDAMEMEFSPNSKYFLGGRVFRFGMGGSDSVGPFFFSWGFDADQEAFIAYDLEEKKEIKLPNSLRNIVSAPFAFYANDMLVGQHRKDPEKSGLFTFPGGERVEKFFLNANSYEKPFMGDYILVRPTKINPVAVYSIPQKKFLLANKTPAMDGYGDFFVSEGSDGIVDLVRMTGEKIENAGSVALPRSELGEVKTVAVSSGLDKLAISETARGGVWDLTSGAMKIYIRGFRGSHFNSDGSLYAAFPPFDKEPRTMAQLDPATGGGKMLDPIESYSTKQIGRFLLRARTKLDDELEKRRKKAEKDGQQTAAVPEDEQRKQRPTFHFSSGFLVGMDLGEYRVPETTLEVSDAITRATLWSRRFENGAPKHHLDPRSETVTLYWPVTSAPAKEIIRTKPDLANRLKGMGEKQGDYLVQVLNASNGNSLGELLIETGEGSFTIKQVSATGDWIAVVDSENRILFYSLKSGDLVSRAFGEKAILNATRSIGIVMNVDGILVAVDLKTGRRIDDLRFPSSITYATFSGDESKLFVLTENQQYYIFDLNAFQLRL